MATVEIQKDGYQVRLTVIAGAFAELLDALDRVDDTLHALVEVERLDPGFRINAVVPTGGDEPPLTAGGGERSAGGAPPWGGDQPEGAPPTWGAGADEPVTWGGK